MFSIFFNENLAWNWRYCCFPLLSLFIPTAFFLTVGRLHGITLPTSSLLLKPGNTPGNWEDLYLIKPK